MHILFTLIILMHISTSLAEEGNAVDSKTKENIKIYESFVDALEKPAARLRILNKQNGDIRRFNLPKGRKAAYENLEIELYHCRTKDGKAPPHAAAIMKITEIQKEPQYITDSMIIKEVGKPKKILYFDGWMISHHPELAPLEHPVYDVVLEDCVNLLETPETEK